MIRCLATLAALLCAECTAHPPSAVVRPTAESVAPSSPASAGPTPVVRSGATPVSVGKPIERVTLTGRIVFDDFEDLYTMAADGSGLRQITRRDGA